MIPLSCMKIVIKLEPICVRAYPLAIVLGRGWRRRRLLLSTVELVDFIGASRRQFLAPSVTNSHPRICEGVSMFVASPELENSAEAQDNVQPQSCARGAGRVAFDNHGLNPRDRFDAYASFLAAQGDWCQIRAHRVPPEQFFARAVRLYGTSTGLHQFAVSPVCRFLTPGAANQCGREMLCLRAMRAGRGVVNARGRVLPFAASSLLPLLNDEPYCLIHDTPHSGAWVAVPTERLSLTKPELRRAAFVPFSGHTDLAVLLLTTVGVFLEASLSEPDDFDCHLASLTDLVLRSVMGRQPDHSGTADARRLQIEQHVRKNFCNPNLSTLSIANTLGISARLVHKIFEHHSETLHDLIQRHRVEHAGYLLSRTPPLTLDDIARRCGFGSVRTLVRAFRRTYGTTPAQHRS